MRDDVDLVLHLRLLDEFAVGTHAALGEALGERVADECRAVQARQCDELPAIAQSCETLDVRLLLVARHRLLPVEGWGEVVCESREKWWVG